MDVRSISARVLGALPTNSLNRPPEPPRIHHIPAQHPKHLVAKGEIRLEKRADGRVLDQGCDRAIIEISSLSLSCMGEGGG